MENFNQIESDILNKLKNVSDRISYEKIKMDRKVLADIAYNDPEVFKSIVKKVQSSLN